MELRAAANSPFAPGSDHVPQVWAGREVELADFHGVVVPRRLAGVYERGRMVLGEPGIGKSVLINKIAAEAREAGHWVTDLVRVSDATDAVGTTLRTLAANIHREGWGGGEEGGLLERVQGITLPVVGGGVTLRATDDQSRYTDLARLLSATARAALDQQPSRMLVVRIDEVQQLSGAPLSQLLTALADVLAEEVPVRDPAGTSHRVVLPVAVYLSGLPSFVQRVTEAGATFARRFRIHELDPLDDAAMRLALTPFVREGWTVMTPRGPEPVRMEPAAVDRVIEGSHGSPFLFQLLGDAAWVAGTGAVITAEEARIGKASARREVRRYVELRLAGLTELQRAYLQAAAALDPDDRTAGAIAAALGRESVQLGSTARALEHTHRLIRREAGRVVLTSPGLEPYLRDEL